MGYTTRFDGEIFINPPLTWAQIKDSPFLPDNAKRGRDQGRDLKFDIEEANRETDEGTLRVRRAIALVSTWDDEARGYDIVKHLQEVVDTYPEHEFVGRIDCEGEENSDIWRLKVVDRRATKFEAIISWPEGSE